MREALPLKAADVVSNKSVVNVLRRDLKTTRFVVVAAIVGGAVAAVGAAVAAVAAAVAAVGAAVAAVGAAVAAVAAAVAAVGAAVVAVVAAVVAVVAAVVVAAVVVGSTTGLAITHFLERCLLHQTHSSYFLS